MRVFMHCQTSIIRKRTSVAVPIRGSATSAPVRDQFNLFDLTAINNQLYETKVHGNLFLIQ